MNNDTDIHPFEITIGDEEVEDLRQRLASSRWPHSLSAVGWERGVPREYLVRTYFRGFW